METNVPQANPSSSDGVTSNPNSPASPDSEEESYSHLLRPPNSSDTAEGSLIVQDHSATRWVFCPLECSPSKHLTDMNSNSLHLIHFGYSWQMCRSLADILYDVQGHLRLLHSLKTYNKIL